MVPAYEEADNFGGAGDVGDEDYSAWDEPIIDATTAALQMAETIKHQEALKSGVLDSDFVGLGTIVNYNSVRKFQKTLLFQEAVQA
jgi:hypothetical protein